MEAEEQAAELGWTPKEQWVEKGGDPDKWRDATQFMEYGQQNVKFVRKALEAELAQKDKDFEDRLGKIEQASKAAIEASDKKAAQEYQGRVKHLIDARTKAAEADDLSEFNKIDAAIRSMEGQKPAQRQPEPEGPSVASKTFHDKFMPLIDRNDGVKQFADDAYATITRDNPQMSEADCFAEMATRIEENFSDEFPQFFGKPTRQTKVDTSDGNADSGGSSKSAKDLPKEAREAAESFVSQGLFKSVDEYATKYFEE